MNPVILALIFNLCFLIFEFGIYSIPIISVIGGTYLCYQIHQMTQIINEEITSIYLHLSP